MERDEQLTDEYNGDFVRLPEGTNVPSVGAPNLPLAGQGSASAAIAAGLELSETQQNAAWLDAYGVPPTVIEENLGLPAGALFTLRGRDHYRTMVERCLQVRAQHTVDGAGDVESLFNAQIRPSARTLIEIRDNPYASATARLKAAQQFLDRAPDAPKVRTESTQQRTVIVLPVQDLRNMQQALLEEGTTEDMETYELLRGVDFESEEGDVQLTDGAVQAVEVG